MIHLTRLVAGTAVLIASAAPRPAAAPTPWKPNTHLFAANKALDDAVVDGKVSIPPYGQFAVNASALRAIRAFPEAYRAGVVGPDVFPDIVVGQSLIHVDNSADNPDGWTSDDFMRRLFTAAHAYREGDDRDRALAFAYGFLTHASGDMFAHTYVNEKAGGAWDYSIPGTVTKHVVIESYVGQHTPPTNMAIHAWPRFVAEALIKDPAARQHMKPALHYQRLLAIYDWLQPSIDRAYAEMSKGIANGAPYSVKCAAHPVLCARKEQMEAWKLDIDRGFRALVETNEVLGDAILTNDMGEGVDAYHAWASEWVPKMLGAHAVGEGTKAMDEFMAWVATWDPLAPIKKAVDAEVKAFLEEKFAREFALFDMMKNPASYLEQQLGRDGAQQVIRDLHMGAAPDSLLDWRQFEPLYNSVIIAKLALLDGDGLNELAKRAGIASPLFPPGEETNVMIGFLRMMDGDRQWDPSSKYGYTYSAYSPGPQRMALTPARAGLPVRGLFRATSGFPLFANAMAREKVFNVIFKGYGPGPGPMALEPNAPWLRVSARTDGIRPLVSAADEVEHMREVVGVIEKRFGGSAQPAAGPPSLRILPGAKSWAAQNCPRELQELRDALLVLQRATGQLRAAPSLLGIPGHAGAVGQGMDAGGRELAARLGRFAIAPDGATAATALKAFDEQLTVIARTSAGR